MATENGGGDGAAGKRRAPVVPTARTVAADVVVRVLRDGAFAAAALDAELDRRVQLAARDRALATELVYGALRVRAWLEERLGAFAARGLGGVDVRTRAHLIVAAYQLYFLTRVPAFAAVDEAVGAVSADRGARVGAFANAVLRRVAAEARANGGADPAARFAEAIGASMAPWMRAALARAIGDADVAPYVAAGASAAPIGLRVEDPTARDTWLARLREAAPEAEIALGSVSPLALVARGTGRVQHLPGYADGQWAIQEEGSQLVALALGAAAGETVLDACAGRGNKTAVLARAVGAGGAVDAVDVHPAKLERLRTELARVKLVPRATYAVDWSVGAGDVDATYDAVLVDAPCSGVGTLRRRPELGARRQEGDLALLRETQVAIVDRVAERVRAGGRLVYAVCSVFREEAEDVIARVVAGGKLVPAPFTSAPTRAIAGENSAFRLLPHVHGTDGYFVASFRRR